LQAGARRRPNKGEEIVSRDDIADLCLPRDRERDTGHRERERERERELQTEKRNT